MTRHTGVAVWRHQDASGIIRISFWINAKSSSSQAWILVMLKEQTKTGIETRWHRISFHSFGSGLGVWIHQLGITNWIFLFQFDQWRGRFRKNLSTQPDIAGWWRRHINLDLGGKQENICQHETIKATISGQTIMIHQRELRAFWRDSLSNYLFQWCQYLSLYIGCMW